MGFEIADSTIDIPSDDIEEGKVVKTNPMGGTKHTKGTKITIYVSTGDSKVEVVDYKGKNYLEVRGALESDGIIVYIEKKEVDKPEDYDEGQIIGQSVEPGKKLSAKDSITLYIPNISTKYPDFRDGTYTIDDVQKFCDEYGVKLEIEYDESSSAKPDTILKQSRPKGYTVTSGTTLKITVAAKKTSGGGDGGATNPDDGCNELTDECEE